MSFWSDIGGFFEDIWKGVSSAFGAASVQRQVEGTGINPNTLTGGTQVDPSAFAVPVIGGSYGSNMFTGLFNGILGLAGGMASSAMNYHYQKKLLAQQDEIQRRFAGDSPSISKAAMEKAGLNPLLASGSGYSTSTEPINSGSNNTDLAGSMASMMSSAAALKQSQSAEKTADTNADVGKSTVMTNAVNNANNTAKTQAEIYNDTRLTDAKIQRMGAEIGHFHSAALLNNMKRKQLNEAGYFDRSTYGASGFVTKAVKGVMDWFSDGSSRTRTVNHMHYLKGRG